MILPILLVALLVVAMIVILARSRRHSQSAPHRAGGHSLSNRELFARIKKIQSVAAAQARAGKLKS